MLSKELYWTKRRQFDSSLYIVSQFSFDRKFQRDEMNAKSRDGGSNRGKKFEKF